MDLPYKGMTPVQVEQRVQSSIQTNVRNKPEVVQKALVEGMSALVKIETRLRTESRNVNYNGLNVDTSQAVYMDFQMARGTIKAAKLQVAAEAMAGDIRAAFETGRLTEVEAGVLRGVLTEIVGDVGLAEAYVGGNIASTGNVYNTNVDITRTTKDNNIKPPNPLYDAKMHTDESLQKIIEKEGTDVNEFAALLDADRVLTPAEKALVRRILHKIGKPKKGAVMQKVVPEKHIQKILSGDYGTVRKSVAQASHVSKLKTLLEIYYGLRLDFDDVSFTLQDKTYGRIRYAVEDESSLTHSIDEPGYSWPYTGRGFLGTDKVIVPEYMQTERQYRFGDTLEIIDARTGNVLEIYVFKNKWVLKGGK